MNYKPYAKAITGAAVAGLTAAGTAVADGVISPAEWIGIAIAVLTTGGAVFGVTNTPDES